MNYFRLFLNENKYLTQANSIRMTAVLFAPQTLFALSSAVKQQRYLFVYILKMYIEKATILIRKCVRGVFRKGGNRNTECSHYQWCWL